MPTVPPLRKAPLPAIASMLLSAVISACAFSCAVPVKRGGDEDGARRQPWYLAQLIAETVQGNRFSQFTLDLMELDRYASEQMGVKKGQPVS